MNPTLEFLQQHASVRQFTVRDISPEEERLIIETAERSPTSANLHSYSIISVRDPVKKKKIAGWTGGQAHVAQCPLFLLFCADLHRLRELNRQRGYPFQGDTVEALLVATVDAALAAERALLAAQALGLGGVMVGGVRNDPAAIGESVGLPDLTYPVVGLSLGEPLKNAKIKPRLPLEGLWFKERYDEPAIGKAVEDYDRTILKLNYLKGSEVEPERYPGFTGEYAWAEHSARRMASEEAGTLRLHMMGYLKAKGFLRR